MSLQNCWSTTFRPSLQVTERDLSVCTGSKICVNSRSSSLRSFCLLHSCAALLPFALVAYVIFLYLLLDWNIFIVWNNCYHISCVYTRSLSTCIWSWLSLRKTFMKETTQTTGSILCILFDQDNNRKLGEFILTMQCYTSQRHKPQLAKSSQNIHEGSSRRRHLAYHASRSFSLKFLWSKVATLFHNSTEIQ